jgi:hypothetical protein
MSGGVGYVRTSTVDTTIFVGARDRGGRVAHLRCLDFPIGVKKVWLMDIAPTLTMYRRTPIKSLRRSTWGGSSLSKRRPCQSISLGSILSSIWNIALVC